MDAVADFPTEHVVDEPVLGDPAESGECRGLDDRVEVMAVAGDLRAGSGNTGFDPVPQLIRGHAHRTKRSARPWLYFVKQ